MAQRQNDGFVLHRIDDLEIRALVVVLLTVVLHRIDDLEMEIDVPEFDWIVLHRIDDLENSLPT